MQLQIVRRIVLVVSLLGLIAWAVPAEGRTLLKTICRVKGQEENVIQGMGIVVGLKGTGDGNSSAAVVRSMAQIMQNFGMPTGKAGPAELKDMKNVAVVIVTATIPAAGARQGDKLDCMVSSAYSAKSLAGGRLFTTYLTSQNRMDSRVYAVADGPITLDSATQTTTGRIHTGCRLEEDFLNVFTQDGKITLVLDRNYADFQVASEVAVLINSSTVGFQSNSGGMAKALNQNNIEVTIPRQYADAPVEFISQVLGLQISEPQTGSRVVINERAGSIVMSGDAEIGPVVVTHKNIVVETGSATTGARFVPIDPKNDAPTLKSLVEALNAVHVPTEDIIEVIKGLERNGKLRAQLIIE